MRQINDTICEKDRDFHLPVNLLGANITMLRIRKVCFVLVCRHDLMGWTLAKGRMSKERAQGLKEPKTMSHDKWLNEPVV